MNIFTASGVEKKYANHLALDNVSLEVPEGSIFGLLGPNGAGKTTLIRIINQITGPDKGELLYKGRPLQASDVREFGYLPEERGLYKKMKVGEQALYLARLKGLSKNDALRKLKIWFEKFEIQEWWNKKVEELSKGMQQKVQFIVTILHDPKLLIFDEPFSGFDPINANLLKNEILELQKNGATIIFSTHNMSSVEELCSHITLINQSRAILAGSMEEVKSTYRTNTYSVSFEGDPDRVKQMLDGRFQVNQSITSGKSTNMHVQITGEVQSNELLSLMVPLVHVTAYQELLPGMNDIFIRVVEQSKQANQSARV
jgi:ABC-2 type transport system ATP-binding protein